MCMTCTLLQIQWFSYSPLATVSCEGSSVPLDKMQVGFQRRKPSTSMLYLQCHGKVRWEHSHVHQSLTSNKNLQQDSLDSVSIRFLRAQNLCPEGQANMNHAVTMQASRSGGRDTVQMQRQHPELQEFITCNSSHSAE